MKKQCPSYGGGQRDSSYNRRSNSRGGRKECYVCGSTSHLANRCPDRKGQGGRSDDKSSSLN